MSDIKKSAIIFKQRAKELGYDIKLTHCQEILAKINGHKTRHSHLLAEKNEEPVDLELKQVAAEARLTTSLMKSILNDNISDGIESYIAQAAGFSVADREYLIKQIAKQLDLESVKDHYEIIKLGLNVLSQGNSERFYNSYSTKDYILGIEKNKFNDKFLFGFSHNDNKIQENIKDMSILPNALFVGCMGSGKSLSAMSTVATWLMSNGDKSEIYIVDLFKGAMDFDVLFEYKQVQKISQDEKFLNLLDHLFDECSRRRELLVNTNTASLLEYENKTKTKINRIITVMEEFHAIPFGILDFEKNYKIEGTPAYKFHCLMRIGRSLGFYFIAISQRGTASDIPRDILTSFTNKYVFKTSKAESIYLLGNDNSSKIRTDQSGLAYSDSGLIQFPIFDKKSLFKMLKKYVKNNKDNV